jgi:predicted RND superfamily exporter protein
MLATFAVFTIMSIISQVLGTLVLFDNPIYKLGPGALGITETIGASIAVGMSVDYTVHIVNAYNNCVETDRHSRIRYSMTIMGISITLGMVATNIAAGCLLLCMIKIFTGFGQFIVMTIFYSWLSAFFILCPLLMLIGPEGSAGEISVLKNLFRNSAGVSGGNGVTQVMVKPESNFVGESKPSEGDVLDVQNEAEI